MSESVPSFFSLSLFWSESEHTKWRYARFIEIFLVEDTMGFPPTSGTERWKWQPLSIETVKGSKDKDDRWMDIFSGKMLLCNFCPWVSVDIDMQHTYMLCYLVFICNRSTFMNRKRTNVLDVDSSCALRHGGGIDGWCEGRQLGKLAVCVNNHNEAERQIAEVKRLAKQTTRTVLDCYCLLRTTHYSVSSLHLIKVQGTIVEEEYY